MFSKRFVQGLLLLGAYGLSSGVPADALQDGITAWKAGQREQAIRLWRDIAISGHTEASLFLGYAYRNGLGVARDDAEAAAWYRIAAESGHPEAQYELGLMYELGFGVARDPMQATAWYGLATAQACPTELTAGGRLGDR